MPDIDYTKVKQGETRIIKHACKDCIWFEDYSNGRGFCHYNPPKHNPLVHSMDFSFPTVTEKDWCREFTKKET